MPNQLGELTDEEVFGAPVVASVPRPMPQPGELSDEDVFGAPAQPVAEGLGLLSRLVTSANEAFTSNPLAAADRAIHRGLGGLASMVMGPDNLLARGAARADQERIDASKAYEQMPSFMDEPTLPGKALAAGANVLGMVAGSAPDPTSWLAPGRSAVGRALGGAAVNMAADVPSQADDIRLGIQEGIDPLRTAAAGGLGALFGLSPEIAGGVKALFGKRAGVAAEAVPDEAIIDAVSNGDAEVIDMLKQAGVTDEQLASMSPEFRDKAAQRIAERRAKDDFAGAYNPKQPGARNIEQERAVAEGIAAGEVDPSRALIQPGKPQVPPDVIAVASDGTARTGDASLEAGATLRSGRPDANALVPVEPQPTRMSDEEIRRAQRQSEAGKPAGPPGDTLTAPPDRAPQTRDDVAGQRQADEAFRLAEAQRQRAGEGIRDTQPPARPQGGVESQRAVVMDDDFPVQVGERRMVPDAQGRMVEVAKVRRYDPRTGQPDPDAVEYEVPVRQLKTRRYPEARPDEPGMEVANPRLSQDFEERAKSPAGDKLGMERQTYRMTPPDVEPTGMGAARPAGRDGGPEIRSPRPDQGEGPQQKRWSSAEEAQRDFEERARAREEARARQDAEDEGQRAGREEAAASAGRGSSNTAKAPDKDGRYEVSERGFVVSDKGGPVVFADQKQAARWILKAQQKSPDQTFEIENHPTKKGGFTVRERNLAERRARQGAGEPPPEPPGDAAPAGETRALPPPEPRTEAAPEPDRVAREEMPRGPAPTLKPDTVARENMPKGPPPALTPDRVAREGMPAGPAKAPKLEPDRVTREEMPEPKKAAPDPASEPEPRQEPRRAPASEPPTGASRKPASIAEVLAAAEARDADLPSDPAARKYAKLQRSIEKLERQKADLKRAADEIAEDEARFAEVLAKTEAEKKPGWEKKLKEDREFYRQNIAERKSDVRGRERAITDGINGAKREARQYERDYRRWADSQPKTSSVTLSANPIGAVKWIAETLFGPGKEWGAAIKAMADLRGFRGITHGRADGQSIVGDLLRSVLYTADGHMRNIADSFPGSKTLTDTVNQFFAVAGRGDGAGRTLDEAIHMRMDSRVGRVIEPIMEEIRASNLDHDLIVKMVQSPSLQRGKAGAVAAKIGKLLKEELDYMREAGVDVGEVKGGYWPRELDMAKVSANRQGFIDAAVKAYRATDPSLSLKQATEMANGWLDNATFGDVGAPGVAAKGQKPSFTQGRVLDKKADDILRPFYETDIDAVLNRYVGRAAKRAEIARRFGDGWSKWGEIEEKIKAEGAGGAIEALRGYAATAAGVAHSNVSHSVRSTTSLLRTWTTLGMLEKATLSSLMEPFVVSMRSGNLGDAAGTLVSTVKQIFGKHAGNQKVLRELAEDIGIIAGEHSNALMAARFAGGDPIGKKQSQILSSYFRRTGLEQWTNATRVASMRTGQVFLRRLARQAEAGSKDARFFLRELGVAEADIKSFAGWVNSHGDRLPGAPDLAKGGANADAYRTALMRFTDQSIMRPSAATKPRWASHPVGAVIFQLQAYNYAFGRNVLQRSGRLVTAAARGEISKTQAMATLGSQLATFMGPIFLGNMALGAARDALFGDPAMTEAETTSAKIEKAFSRSGGFGPLDPYVQMLGATRYNKGVVESFTGPFIGKVGGFADAFIGLAARNSPNTNTAERRAWMNAYDMGIEPALNVALSATPVAPIQAGLTTVGIPALRNTFVDAIAGPAKARDIQPIEGALMGLVTNTRKAFGGPTDSRRGRPQRAERPSRPARD